MQQERSLIKKLLPILNTSQVSLAQYKLTEICKSEHALQYLKHLLTDEELAIEIKQLAASHISRMLIKQGSNFGVEFTNLYLTSIIADTRISFAIKKMIISCLQYKIQKTEVFAKFLIGIGRQIVDSIRLFAGNSANILQKQSLKDSMIKMECEQDLVSGCYAFIIIGRAMFSLLFDKKEGEQQKQFVKILNQRQQNILNFLRHCQQLHNFIFNIQNIRNHPNIFVELFKTYQMLTDYDINEQLRKQIYLQIAHWPLFKDHFLLIYALQQQSQKLTSIAQIQRGTSLFHSKLAQYLIENSYNQLLRGILADFTNTFKQKIRKYNQTPQKYTDLSLNNFLLLIKCSYLSEIVSTQVMMQEFQTIILPIVSKIITSNIFQLFENSPDQLYLTLCGSAQGDNEGGDTLSILSAIVNHLASSSQDFFLFLFQMFRYSFERRLNCQNNDGWQVPQYLIGKQSTDISVVFYIMSCLTYSNQVSEHILTYLKGIVNQRLINQLQNSQIAIFYFFMQSLWFELYNQNFKEGFFWLTFVFKNQLHQSSIYFIYEFIYQLSDYIIDKNYILAYLKNLPEHYSFTNQWKNIFKWLQYLEDLDDEGFVLEFVQNIKQNMHKKGRAIESNNNYDLSNTEVLNFIDVLIKIAKNINFMRSKTLIQKVFILEYEDMKYLPNIDIKNSLYQLLFSLFPYFQQLKSYLIQILIELLENYLPSNRFFLLLSEYIYHLIDPQLLIYIYKFIDTLTNKLDGLNKIKQNDIKDLLLEEANCMILFQNLLVKHWQVFHFSIGKDIACKAIAIKDLIDRNKHILDKNTSSDYYWTLYVRTVNIELTFYRLLEYDQINYQKFLNETSRMMFKDYDAKFLIETLIPLNLSASSKDRGIILKIIKNLLSVLLIQKEQDDIIERRFAHKELYFLPNKMTQVINASKTVFREIKKFMVFYNLPAWHKITERATNLPPNFVSQLKTMYEKCGRENRAKENLQALLSDFILMIDGEKSVILKRRRDMGQSSQDQNEDKNPIRQNSVRRKALYQSFTKRIKRQQNKFEYQGRSLAESNTISEQEIQHIHLQRLDISTLNEKDVLCNDTKQQTTSRAQGDSFSENPSKNQLSFS